MSEDEGRRPPLSREASLAARGYNRLRYSVRLRPDSGSVPLCAPRARVTWASSSLTRHFVL